MSAKKETNVDKAAKVIDQWTRDGSELNSAVGSPREIATLLADAGLLAPELPEPDRNTHMWYPTAYGRGIGNVVTRDEGVKLNINTSRALEPYEARELAHMVLAAANQAEKEQGEA